MKTIINAFILGFCFLCISNSAIYAQITQWPVEVKGSRNGAGTPKQLTYGYNPEAITSFKENKIGKKPKKNAKPAKIHFKYKAFDASQIVVTETFNPGNMEAYALLIQPLTTHPKLTFLKKKFSQKT